MTATPAKTEAVVPFTHDFAVVGLTGKVFLQTNDHGTAVRKVFELHHEGTYAQVVSDVFDFSGFGRPIRKDG